MIDDLDTAKLEEFSVLRTGYQCWLDFRGERNIPLVSSRDPRAMVSIMPNIVIFGVQNDPRDFKYRLIGTTVESHNSGYFTGKTLSEMPGKGPGSMIWNHFCSIVETGKPSFKDLPYVGPQKDFQRMSMIALPFGNEEGDVTQIMIVTEYVLMEKDPTEFTF